MVDELKAEEASRETAPRGGVRTTRVVTIPNIICMIRLLGSFVLVALAWAGRGEAFLWLFVALAMTDWVDGKLAILLHQRTVLGARLDSWADAALYIALLIGCLRLHGETLRHELAWLVPAVASYALSTIAGLWKYGCWPSYHTRAAKTSWFLILVGAVCLLGGWSLWPLRIALAGIVVTNLETLIITILSPTWRSDVGSILRILRERRPR
ncbi:MAG: CDP-alcohol phosphatidyltransferase family protein [Akkermansiaceae bacterium]|nr:CDP-alcohol phosphatidyltransferase family protein [Akkermansiaceae bacterium]NNM30540.1 CDP-alcohol phosphatidyltransferase family protein [Akkermansiaceae bacterium]